MNQSRGPRYKQTTLWRDASQFMVDVEEAVRRIPRYHKYTLGTDLRRHAMSICRLVARAAQVNDTQRREAQLEQHR